ncbi:MAG: hypothetical protein IPK83_20075 [Planctomycetes bacterium]|nr:hypothetical protein [Planctomycetota bacterium]
MRVEPVHFESKMHPRRAMWAAHWTAALALLIASAQPALAQVDDEAYIVVKVKKAITISGDEITDAMIVITGGKIEAVGKKVDYPSDSYVIDASDLVAMPGMIDPRTSIGLPRLNRSGNQSHKKLTDVYYPPDDDTYEKLLESGYVLLGLNPPGGGMPGQMLLQTTHQPKEREGLKDAGLVRVVFTRPAMDKRLLRETLKQAQAEIDKEKEATSKPTTTSAPAARSQPTSQPATQPTSGPASKPAASKPAATKPAAAKVRPELEPWIALLKKDPAFAAQIEFARASDVIHFADVVKDVEFNRTFAFAGFEISDVHNVVDHALLGGADAIIALPPNLPNMPLTVNPYNPAKRFIEAGCTVTLFPLSDSVQEHERMRERLALLVRNGLPRGDALKAVTLNAAKYLKIEKEYGSIEKRSGPI